MLGATPGGSGALSRGRGGVLASFVEPEIKQRSVVGVISNNSSYYYSVLLYHSVDKYKECFDVLFIRKKSVYRRTFCGMLQRKGRLPELP